MPIQETELDLAIDAVVRERPRRSPAGEGTLQPDEILAYFEGKLSEQENDRIREILTEDTEARRALLDLEALQRMEGEVDLSESDVSALWQDTRETLVSEGLFEKRQAASVVPLTVVSERSEPARPARSRWVHFSPALAAIFLLAVVGLGGWNFKLQRALNQPHAAGKVETLAPAETAERGPATAVTARISQNDVILLDLEGPFRGMCEVRVLAVEEGRSRIIWRGTATTDEYGNVTLEPPRIGYARGSYQVELTPLEDSQGVASSVSFRFVVD